MDFKGITWAGNIYQKFEAMCLEVEEVMYEDTVKYVENQVEKVGVSVKKFYSEIMTDLLPTSCVDPVKVAVGDLPLKPYTQTDINKKPKSTIVDIYGELGKKETKDESDSNITAEKSSLNLHNDANRLTPLPSSVLVENTRSGACSTISKKVGVYKRPIGIKRISKNNRPAKISHQTTSSSRDESSLLACDMRSKCLVASDDMNVARSLELLVRNDHGEAVAKHAPISDASFQSFSCDQNLSAESVRQEKNDSQSTSLAVSKVLSDESFRQNKDDSKCNSSCHDLPTESTCTPTDKFRKDGPLSQIKSNIENDTCEVDSEGEKVITSYEGNFDVEVIETEDIFETRVELDEPVEKSKLEESCILVEIDKLHIASQGITKHKSYKKKIREVLSSKLRPTRKRDHHVFHYKDSADKNNVGLATPTLTMDCDERKFPARDSCESDWELL